MEHITTGKKGEAIAYDYLKKKGYNIVEINYKNKIGEIDIICKDKDELVFVEVKTRSSYRFGLPREAVNEWKQNKIHNVAMVYLMKNKLVDGKYRFDVIEICGDKIEHLVRCF